MSTIGIAPGYGVQEIVVGSGLAVDETNKRAPVLSAALAWVSFDRVYTKDDFVNSIPDNWAYVDTGLDMGTTSAVFQYRTEILEPNTITTIDINAGVNAVNDNTLFSGFDITTNNAATGSIVGLIGSPQILIVTLPYAPGDWTSLTTFRFHVRVTYLGLL